MEKSSVLDGGVGTNAIGSGVKMCNGLFATVYLQPGAYTI
jgi:hypothetical protein